MSFDTFVNTMMDCVEKNMKDQPDLARYDVASVTYNPLYHGGDEWSVLLLKYVPGQPTKYEACITQVASQGRIPLLDMARATECLDERAKKTLALAKSQN